MGLGFDSKTFLFSLESTMWLNVSKSPSFKSMLGLRVCDICWWFILATCFKSRIVFLLSDLIIVILLFREVKDPKFAFESEGNSDLIFFCYLMLFGAFCS